jgi:uncharacterized membrane protein YphA (DoxX/SURF4 family)
MNKIFLWLTHPPTNGPGSTLFLRLMAGGVFFWEGLLKFVYTFIGGLEIVGGLLLISGLATRLIAIPFVAEMIVAILTTKIALFLGTSPLPLPPAPPRVGMWAVLHEIRSDYAQIITTLFLLVNGPGKWSLDAVLARRSENSAQQRVKPASGLDLGATAAD